MERVLKTMLALSNNNNIKNMVRTQKEKSGYVLSLLVLTHQPSILYRRSNGGPTVSL
jgi:hypothetical protein